MPNSNIFSGDDPDEGNFVTWILQGLALIVCLTVYVLAVPVVTYHVVAKWHILGSTASVAFAAYAGMSALAGVYGTFTFMVEYSLRQLTAFFCVVWVFLGTWTALIAYSGDVNFMGAFIDVALGAGLLWSVFMVPSIVITFIDESANT